MKLAAAVVVASVLLIGQDPQQPPRPIFKSSVDVVPVDVSVVDKTGRPVNNLESADFVLTVDGRPRRIASTEFISLTRYAEDDVAPTFHASNAAATGGRLIALVVDQGNIGAGTGKLAIDAAKRFVAGLNRADRIALYTIPGAGPRIDFTANHLIVQSMLDNIVGTAVQNVGPHNIGVSEIFGLERNDQRIVENLIDRECPGFRSPEEVSACRAQLSGEARALSAEIRGRTADSLLGLRQLLQRFAAVPSPKSMVLISEGLLIDRNTADVNWVSELAAKAQLSLYVLQLEPPMFDGSNPRVSATRMADIDLAQQGLGYLAGLARGDVFRVTAGGDFAFKRIALELSGYYLLSFEPEPGDRDGKTHKIKIAVPGRSGVLVRARNEFAVDAVKTKTVEERLGETLRSPLLATDIKVKATAYTFWDVEARKLRVMIASDIDRSANPTGSVSVAYALLDEKQGIAASDHEARLAAPIGTNRTQSYVAAALVDPGVFTLKLGVIDEGGKRGSLEYAFRARLEEAGQVRIGGPLLATRDDNTGPLRTAVSGEITADVLHAYLELYSDAPDQLKNASVTIEIANDAQSRAVESAAIRFGDAGHTPRSLVGEAALPIALLPAGDYVVRAVVNVFGRKAGQAVRPFRIVKDRKP